MSSNSSSVRSSTGFVMPRPALFTHTSTWPSAAIAWSRSRSTSPRFVTSVGTTMAPPARFATSFSSCSRRAASATRCPLAPSCTARGARIPLLAPVMTMLRAESMDSWYRDYNARMRRLLVSCLVASAALTPAAAFGAETPIAYTVRFEPASHVARVSATFPADGRATIDLMMAVWSPGFYRVENYATRVADLSARAPDGGTLRVERPQPNRWRVDTRGAAAVVVEYGVRCTERSVTTNFVGDEYAVLNGAPTFITLAERIARPHE